MNKPLTAALVALLLVTTGCDRRSDGTATSSSSMQSPSTTQSASAPMGRASTP